MITILYTGLIIIFGLSINMENPKSRIKYLIFSGLILVLISTLRSYYAGGGDTSTYAYSVEKMSDMSYSEIYNETGKDPIYNVVTEYLYHLFAENFQCVLCVFALLFVFSYEKLIYHESPNLLISFVVLWGMGFFNFSMTGVRQGIALSFVMLSYFPLRDKQFFKFLILIALASCFHKTALIFIVAYPFCRMGINIRTIALYGVLIVFFALFGDKLLHGFLESAAVYDERFSGYIDTDKTLTMGGFFQLALFLLLALFNYNNYTTQDKESSILLPLLFLAIIFQTFAIFIAEMFRVAMYFSVFLVILLPRLLLTYREEYRSKLSFIVCAVLMLYFYTHYLEYDFFWNDVEIDY